MTAKRQPGSLKSRLIANTKHQNAVRSEQVAPDPSQSDDWDDSSWNDDIVELPAIMMTGSRPAPTDLPEAAANLPHWRDKVPNLIEPEMDLAESEDTDLVQSAAHVSPGRADASPHSQSIDKGATQHSARAIPTLGRDQTRNIPADDPDARNKSSRLRQAPVSGRTRRISSPAARSAAAEKAARARVATTPEPSAKPTPIVPRATMAGRALTLVIAIMGFLACLTVGGLTVLYQATSDWQSDIARQVTIQIEPAPGVDMEAALIAGTRIAENWPGVSSATALSDAETKALLQPWLGAGLDINDLPVPRLIQINLADRALFDAVAAQQELTAVVPEATLDDHQRWTDRLTTMASAALWVGLLVFVLVLTAMILSVTFATRAAMAANRNVIEVLHLVGAENSFIAGQFQAHFLVLGLQGGLSGGFAAVLSLFAASYLTSTAKGSALADQVAALTGGFQIGLPAILGSVAVVFLVAMITALTSRLTVQRFVHEMG